MALTINKKWDIIWVDHNPIKGSEISKIRPCLIVSTNAVNTYMNTITVVPFTSKPKGYPFRVSTKLNGTNGELCFDHIRSIDKRLIVSTVGALDKSLRQVVNSLLVEFFSE